MENFFLSLFARLIDANDDNRSDREHFFRRFHSMTIINLLELPFRELFEQLGSKLLGNQVTFMCSSMDIVINDGDYYQHSAKDDEHCRQRWKSVESIIHSPDLESEA